MQKRIFCEMRFNLCKIRLDTKLRKLGSGMGYRMGEVCGGARGSRRPYDHIGDGGWQGCGTGMDDYIYMKHEMITRNKMPMWNRWLILRTMWDYLFVYNAKRVTKVIFTPWYSLFWLIDDNFHNCIWKLKSSNTKNIITLYVVLLLSENEIFHFKKPLWKPLLFKVFQHHYYGEGNRYGALLFLPVCLRICLCNFWLWQKPNTISIFCTLDNFRVPIIGMPGTIGLFTNIKASVMQ